MSDRRVAIVDFGLGNLYSVKHACEHAGLDATITSDSTIIDGADAVVLPGVGAFGDAMRTLRRLGLVDTLRQFAASGRPLAGICLGLQLLMEESEEFGVQEGLGLIPGRVVSLDGPREGDRLLKVPQIGWNGVSRPDAAVGGADPWLGTWLEGVADGEPFYFVHSLIVRPADPSVVLATTTYGGIQFCSALRRDNVFACQFHPERSAAEGLRMYDNFARLVAGAI